VLDYSLPITAVAVPQSAAVADQVVVVVVVVAAAEAELSRMLAAFGYQKGASQGSASGNSE